MELISHLGLVPQPNPTLASVHRKLVGVRRLAHLFLMLLAYHPFSALCSVAALLFPSVDDVKRSMVSELWGYILLWVRLFIFATLYQDHEKDAN